MKLENQLTERRRREPIRMFNACCVAAVIADARLHLRPVRRPAWRVLREAWRRVRGH